MYQLIQRIIFFLKAQTAHGLHSPLVFDLYTKVINPNLWPFQKDIFDVELEKFIESKFELKSFKLLKINNINELNDFNPAKNQVVLIHKPFRNMLFKEKVELVAQNELFNYIIHFFHGSIFISSELAPRQTFYLKHMQ